MIVRKALVIAMGLGALHAVSQDSSQVKTTATCSFSEVFATEERSYRCSGRRKAYWPQMDPSSGLAGND
jgi:hypothetical protein